MAGETITYPIRVAHCPLVARYNIIMYTARTDTHTQMASLATRIYYFLYISLSICSVRRRLLLFADQLFNEIDALFVFSISVHFFFASSLYTVHKLRFPFC